MPKLQSTYVSELGGREKYAVVDDDAASSASATHKVKREERQNESDLKCPGNGMHCKVLNGQAKFKVSVDGDEGKVQLMAIRWNEAARDEAASD